MTSLQLSAVLLGGAAAVVGGGILLDPARARAWTASFPRSRWAAWLLTAVDLVWSAWLLFNMPMERFDHLKPLLYVLTPVAFVLIIFFMDDLLAPRALGGLMLLIPAPVLHAARGQPSAWRIVVVLLAYVLVVAGAILTLNPYQFRKTVGRALADDASSKAWGAVGLGLGVFTILLGLRFR